MLRTMLVGFGLLLLVATEPAAAQTLAAPATWTSQHGSVLAITTVAPTGKFGGTFVNNDAHFDCKGIAFPVLGKTNGKRITFSVTWANGKLDCQSFTLWTGSFDGHSIKAAWRRPYVASTWSLSTSTGSDTFTIKK